MKTLFKLLLTGIFLLLIHTKANAGDLDPTAVIDILPDEVVFLVGDSIYMEAYNSSPNCGYISGYRWQVDGVTESTSGYFIPNLTLQSGEDSRSFDIQLRVQNSVGNYGYKTVTITIVREHTSYYYLTDHLGSVRMTVDDDGNSVGWDDYYPFGLQMPGRTQNQSYPNDDQKFTGYELEQQGDLGLYHAGARMYDPVIGRFSSQDRFKEKYPSMSPYQYAALNPISFIDVNGDSVGVAFYPVGGDFSPWQHAAIIHMDEETGDIKVLAEAFPDTESGNLVGNAQPWNDREEAFGGGLSNDNTQTVPLPEGFENEGEFLDAISSAFNSYNNDVQYALFPPTSGERTVYMGGANPSVRINVGNSNALAGTVLRVAGSDFKPVGVRLPGWDTNIRTIRKPNQ